MNVLANDSQGRRARAISFYDACSCRLLIRPLIRSNAIWLSNIAESPNVAGPNELLSPSLTVSWSLSITFSVTRPPIWRKGKPSLKNGIVKERRNASFASSPVWAIKWNSSPSLRQGSLLPESADGETFSEETDGMGEIGLLVEQSREGQILTSIPPIGPIFAATIIATVGNIANFSRPSQLKSYFGWAPRREQTGVSFDRTHLAKGGSREMKRAMFLIVLTANRMKETEWAKLYERLVPRLCIYDERTQSYRGKGKVIGHVAGRLIFLIYALLKKD